MIKKADTVAKRWDELVSSGIGKKLATSLQEFEEKIDTEVSKEKIDITDVIATLRDSIRSYNRSLQLKSEQDHRSGSDHSF